MSANLSPLSNLGRSELLPSDVRRGGRAISRGRLATQVRVARVDDDVDEAIARADGYTTATGAASADVLRVARLHKELETLAPEVSGRLALLADDHALTMVDILGGLRRDLRR